MISLVINGEAKNVEAAENLQALLQSLSDLPESYAVAVNTNFVPKSAYANTTLSEGDQIELLVPMQGG